jgi:hypothetical protein
MREDEPVKYILFLNLEFVIVNQVRTFTHALLLEEGPSMFSGIDRRARGFGTDPAWPVFDFPIPSLDYELTDASGGPILITDSKPEGRPLHAGAIMQFKGTDAPRLDLIVQDQDQPLDIRTFEGKWGDRVITDVWEKLSSLVGRYWKAPNMPRLAWGPSPGYRRRG